MSRFFCLLAAGAALCFLTPIRSARAQDSDVIRGRVTGPDILPVENATVTVTSISGNVSRAARTDRGGRYTIIFPGGDGDYLVSIAALGYAGRRFEVKRLADEEFLIADARLQRMNALDPVEVRAQRERPRRNEVVPDVSGTERVISNTEVPADLMGDLAAMAATLPGVLGISDEDGSNAYSVLGLGADQNNTTLNGMMFGGSSLPRDAAVTSSVITSPYDVSRGGFSGAQMSLRTRPGSNFISRGMSMNLDAPQMQWTDAAARSLGQEYSNASLGGLVSGPLVYDKAFYNLSYQLGRRTNDLQTLLTTDPLGLRAAGIASDSVSRLLGIMQQQQIPAIAGALRDDRIGDNGSLFGTIDLTSPTATSGRALNVTFNAGWNRQTPATGSATEVPAFSGDRSSWRFGAQGRHSSFLRNVILSETSVGASVSRSLATPYLSLPAGRVRVSSTFDDGTNGVQMLSFGGNQFLNSRQSTTGTGLLNQLSWFSANNKHRLKLTSELRHEIAAQEVATNQFGTFTYNSLSDLESNAPASFSRNLSPRDRSISQLAGGVALGDAYRRTSNLQITYGVRLDGSRYLSAPDYNPAVDAAFGARTDRLPNRLYVSPRAGFSWTYGSAPQVAGFQGAARAPRAVVRGGLGLFQNLPATGLAGSAFDNTGLPNAVQQITCVGAATPAPDWPGYAADPSLVPEWCADGSSGGGSVFANAAPNVTLFARDYASPRSARSNLQWSGPVLNNRLSATVDATYSLNLNQPSSFDLNFNPTQRFTLDGEGGRPVYVEPTSIVPGTGQIATQDARRVSAYSRVSEMRSDLRSESRQLSLRLAPVRFSTAFSWSASYVLASVREQSRGFSSTAGNPLAIEWTGGSFSSRHQIVYSLGYNFFDFVRVNWFGQFRSGMPFTPMIAGDVNGDGYANDRAFVFDPAASGDTAVANAMQALLTSGSRAARECLSSQLGRIAARYSCEGPWTSSATMSFSFNPLKVRMPQRATLSFQLSNPLGAADMLINGSTNPRGWGQRPIPDAALLYVRGFDPASNQYRYEVNRRFGATDPALSAIRTPVTLTAMLRFDIGPTRERQMLMQQLDRGRRTQGTRAPEVMLRAMYSSGGIPNPLATILREQDSLRLTAPQADSVATLNRHYVVQMEQVWSPLTRDFATLPDSYDRDEVYARYMAARRQTVDLLRQLAPHVKELLTPEQRRKLPPFVASHLDERYLASIRSGTAGAGGAVAMPLGGMVQAARGEGVGIEMRRP